MNQSFKSLVELTKSEDRIKVLEYTDKVPELMSIVMGVVTKPGGLTVTECLVSGLPIVIINPIPGQEEENAEFLVNNGVALWLNKKDNIARRLKYLSRDTDALKQMSENAKKLSKPNATADIANVLITELEKEADFSNNLSVTTLIKYKTRYLFLKNDKDVLSLLEGPINLNESPTDALNRISQNILDVSLSNINKIGFESIFDKHKNQTIYLNYKSEIKEIESNPYIVLLSKDNIKNYKYSEITKTVLKNSKLL